MKKSKRSSYFDKCVHPSPVSTRVNRPPVKIGALLLAASVVASALLAGCAKEDASVSSGMASVAGSSAQTARVSSIASSDFAEPSETASTQAASGSSKPVKIGPADEIVFNISKYKEQIKKAERISGSAQYTYDGMTLAGLYENSTEIVDCKVEKVEFVVIVNGQPQTKLDVKVLESFKGRFKADDHITVYIDGGYITMQEYIKTRQLESRFPGITQQQRANTVYEIKNTDAAAERYAQVGDRYLFGLRTDEILGGGYFPTMGPFTTYRRDVAGRYTRRPDTKEEEGIKMSGNSDESFTLDWFRTKITELQKS